MAQLANVVLNLARATKGTYLYQTSQKQPVRNIYLGKEAVSDANSAPTKVRVIVETIDE